MTPSERRAAMKEELAQRANESYNSKDDSGRFKPIFIKERMANVKTWKCTEDEHFINIIPFLAGTHHPSVAPGKPTYSLDIYVHRKVGLNEDNFICLARTYKKPCPVCEHQGEVRKLDNYNEDYVKSLNPTRRILYNIECLDSDKEIEKGVQLFEVAHFLFEKKVAELAKKPRAGGFILFSDPDEGKTLFFRKKGSGATNTEFTAFAFHDRTESIPDTVLDAAHCLDELIYIPSYDEVKTAFFGSHIEGDGPDETVGGEDDSMVPNETTSSGPATRPTTSSDPEPEPVAGEFQCPGTPPEDFGKFTACEQCPDLAECEKEFVAFEKAAAEKAAAEKAAAEKAAAAPTEVLSPLARRRAELAAQQTATLTTTPTPTTEITTGTPTPTTETTTGAVDSGRRLRRRP